MMNLILASANPVGHVTDKPIYDQWYFSNVTFMLLLSAAVTAWLIIPAAKKIATGESRTLDDYRAQGAKANFVEVICLYLRDDVFRPMLEEETDKYMPMLWTFFWFILINNLLGLVPIMDITALMGINTMTDAHGHQTAVGIGGTATQSIWVTATLAIIASTAAANSTVSWWRDKASVAQIANAAVIIIAGRRSANRLRTSSI